MILQLLLSFIAGCIYMQRGGTVWLPKVPRWACVLMQTVIITPLVYIYDLNPWLLLIYPIGWYITIAWSWGSFFDCKTWPHRFQMFARMSASAALFVALALIKDWHWYSLFIAAQYITGFAAATVLIYTLYNKQPGHTDANFNWSEFATGALLAAMTFNLLVN